MSHQGRCRKGGRLRWLGFIIAFGTGLIVCAQIPPRETIPVDHARYAFGVAHDFMKWLNQFQPQKYDEPVLSPSTITGGLGCWSVGEVGNQAICLCKDGYFVQLYANEAREYDRFNGKFKENQERFSSKDAWTAYANKVGKELGFPRELVAREIETSQTYTGKPHPYKGDYCFEYFSPQQIKAGSKLALWSVDFDRADGEITYIGCPREFGWQAKTRKWVPIHWQKDPPDNPPVE